MTKKVAFQQAVEWIEGTFDIPYGISKVGCGANGCVFKVPMPQFTLDPVVIKLTSDNSEKVCINEISRGFRKINGTELEKNLPKIFDYGEITPSIEVDIEDLDQVTHATAQPLEFYYVLELLKNLSRSEFRNRYNEIKKIVSEFKDIGIRLEDWSHPENWGKRSDETLVFRDIACTVVPVRNKEKLLISSIVKEFLVLC